MSKAKAITEHKFRLVGEMKTGLKGGEEGKRGKKVEASKRLIFEFNPELAKEKDIVYMMCDQDEIMYIGYTATSLLERFENYDKGRFDSVGGTNKKIFKKMMESEKPMQVYVLRGDMVFWHGVNMSLSRSLEYALINKFNPKWNKRQR
jgi:predicted GIY-YIG superfamily endonuclease